jgi:hypothetical protein
MVDELDTEILETEPLAPVTTPEESAAGEPAPSQPRMSVRESIQDAIKKASRPSEDKNTKPPVEGAAAPGQKAGGKVSKPATGAQAGATQNVAGTPQSWSKEELAHWPTLSPELQKAVLRTEENARKGLAEFKSRNQELDSAVAPYRETIKRFGFTDGQAVDQLFKWQMALAGPQKIDAFAALLRSHGVDPATFAAAITGGAVPQPNQPHASTSAQQQIQLPPQLQEWMNGVSQKLGSYDAQVAQQTKSAAEQTVMTWAKDKPHYDKVKLLMGQLIQSGAAKPTPDVDPFALDAAYNMAVYAHPEARDAVTAEQRAKEAAERKATAEKARKAGSSMRLGAPAPLAANGAASAERRNETVRDSIKRALSELHQ